MSSAHARCRMLLQLIRVGGACGPPPPVAAALASSLRAPSRGDPPLRGRGAYVGYLRGRFGSAALRALRVRRRCVRSQASASRRFARRLRVAASGGRGVRRAARSLSALRQRAALRWRHGVRRLASASGVASVRWRRRRLALRRCQRCAIRRGAQTSPRAAGVQRARGARAWRSGVWRLALRPPARAAPLTRSSAQVDDLRATTTQRGVAAGRSA